MKIKGKIKRTNKSNVDFTNTSLIIERKKAFKKSSSRMSNFKNHNLVPISYVVIYESRNPFKKFKKVYKYQQKTNIYDSSNNFQYFETE